MGLSLLYNMGTETPARREGGLREDREAQPVVKGCAPGALGSHHPTKVGPGKEIYGDSSEEPSHQEITPPPAAAKINPGSHRACSCYQVAPLPPPSPPIDTGNLGAISTLSDRPHPHPPRS